MVSCNSSNSVVYEVRYVKFTYILEFFVGNVVSKFVIFFFFFFLYGVVFVFCPVLPSRVALGAAPALALVTSLTSLTQLYVGLAAFIFCTLMSLADASTALISCGVMKRNCLSLLNGSRRS